MRDEQANLSMVRTMNTIINLFMANQAIDLWLIHGIIHKRTNKGFIYYKWLAIT